MNRLSIAQLIKDKVGSLTRLSELSGISLAHVSRIIAGKRTPGLRYAGRLASVLGISVDEFIGLIDRGEVNE
jgi:transcriptional regulator with XRE-family HTH domain